MDESEHEAGAAAQDWSRLAGQLAALGSIAGEAAHRFNNLRTVIEGTLALIAADPTGPLTPRRLERVQEAASRAQALAEALAALGRRRAASDTAFDLPGWLRNAEPWLRSLVARETELSLDLPEAPHRLLADPGALRAALTALVLNAAASAAPGTGHVGRIGIRLASTPAPPSPTMLSLSVADSGSGMTEEIAARAREPFFTTRLTAAGLGLTVAEAFAAHHGGRLELASTPGRGTTVTLHLPL